MRVHVCDDHAVFADSLAFVLADSGHQITGVTYAPPAARTSLLADPPDVCLIDLSFPDGSVLEQLPALCAAAPATCFVLLTAQLDRNVMDAALSLGVRGFAHKGQQTREIIELLARVMEGELVVDEALGRIAPRRPRNQTQRIAQFLTPREKEVLTRLARGESTASLAKAMGVTRSTARSHVQSVLTKLGVHSQREAVIEAARSGLVSVETGEWLVT